MRLQCYLNLEEMDKSVDSQKEEKNTVNSAYYKIVDRLHRAQNIISLYNVPANHLQK